MLTARLRRSAPPGGEDAGPGSGAVGSSRLQVDLAAQRPDPFPHTRQAGPVASARATPVIGDFELDVVDGRTGTDAGPVGIGVTQHIGHRLPQGEGESGLLFSRKHRQINGGVGLDSGRRQGPLRVDQLGAESLRPVPSNSGSYLAQRGAGRLLHVAHLLPGPVGVGRHEPKGELGLQHDH